MIGNPIVLAAIAVAVNLVLYALAGAVQRRFWRGAAQLGSVCGAMAVVFALGPKDQRTAFEVGQYWGYGIIAIWILSKLFGGKST